ncbi:MAG: DUF4157 domain-containing protein [Rhodococcus sp.]|nr:DUF4157 domain-containing protein [Rhodococcus sp. (in: high G+C Gram-positive bacteria)]
MPGSVSPTSTTHQVRPWERFALGGLVVAVAAVMGFAALARENDPNQADATVLGTESLASEHLDAIEVLLDRWSQAIRDGDEQEIDILVDPEADTAFRDAQRDRARWAQPVPFREFEYELTDRSLNAAPAALSDQYDGAQLWIPNVQLRYALEGADEVPTRKSASLVVGQRGDTWTLISDEDAVAPAGAPTSTWRGPWDHGPVHVKTVDTAGGTSMLIGHPGGESTVQSIADELGAAVDHVSSVWGVEWPRRAVVVVTGTDAEFADLVGADFVGDGHDSASIAAVAVSDSPVHADGVVSGQRIIFAPSADERLDPQERRAVLRHELTHVAARSETVDGSPMWMLEGYAEYVAYRDDPRSPRAIAPELATQVDGTQSGSQNRLTIPSDSDFAGESAAAAYKTSWLLALFVADRYGEQELTELYRALASGPHSDAEIDDKLRTVLGVGVDQLVAEWTSWAPTALR